MTRLLTLVYALGWVYNFSFFFGSSRINQTKRQAIFGAKEKYRNNHYFWCIFTSFSQERERLTIAVVHRESTKKHNFYSNKTQKVVGSIHMKEVNWFVMYNHSKHAQDCKEMPYQKPFLKTTIFCFPCLLKEASTLGQKRNIFCQKSLFSSIWYHFKPFSRKISKFLDFKIDFLDKNVFVPQCEKRNTCSDSQEKKKLLRERNSLT